MLHSIDENCRRRFEAAWQSRQKPRIEDFLPAADAESYLPTLEELINIELELAWKRCGKDGGGPLVEGYLERFARLKEPAEPTQAAYTDGIIRLIKAEYETRQEWGDAPLLDEYLARFPEWIDMERELIDASSAPPPTASLLVDDVRRFPADEPVSVHRAPLLDRVGLFLRRHRTMALTGAAALLLVAIVAAVAALLLQA